MSESKTARPHILLGVDLEDIRDLVVGGYAESDRVSSNTDQFIELFDKLDVKANLRSK